MKRFVKALIIVSAAGTLAVLVASVLALSGRTAGQHCQREYGHGAGQASHYEVICRG